MILENLRNILIYRDHLLAPSETFIKSQAEGLTSFQTYFVGSRMVKGLDIESAKRMVINQGGAFGRVKEIGFKLTGYSWGLTKQLSCLKPHLMHAHFGPDGALALPITDKLKIPLVVTFHGYDVTTKDEYAEKSYYTHRNYLKKRRYLQQRGDLFIAVSDFIERKLISQGYPPEKVIRHYIGINIDSFKPNPVIERKPVVLFVGRLVEVKGCSYLIKAMKEVQQAQPDVELVVIGDGPLRSSLERMAAQTLTKYRFLGVQPQSVVKEWMNKSKVFCVPSVTTDSGAEEGFGMVFLEASAMGLPVVSFANGGIPEAVKHQVTGLLADDKDWRGLAAYISELNNDHTLWQSLSMAGQQRTREMFDIHKQTLELEAIYDSLLAGQKSIQANVNPLPVTFNSLCDKKQIEVTQI